MIELRAKKNIIHQLDSSVAHSDEKALSHRAQESPFTIGISPRTREGSVCNVDPSLTNYLNDKIWGRYFKSKLAEIEKLETELTKISGMDAQAWKEYRFYHCSNIRTRHALVLHIFYWQDHYRTQIANVLSMLKEKECQLKN